MMTRRQKLTATLNHRISAMSFGTLLKIAGALVAIITPLAAAARWAHNTANAYPTKAAVESLYVRRDSFAVYQAGESQVHQRDSLIMAATVESMKKDLSTLVRACQKKGDCP